MKITESKKLEMIAYEAFIRRASKINLPFMLKGSYVTRQYFYNADIRIPADLDWVYLNKIIDEKTAREIFNHWVTEITELDLNDGVKFRSFKENEFWRRIDYAMADDFPTVNTDLVCWVDGKELDFGLDISFNLDIEQPPIPLTYIPLKGESFIIPNTVPLSLQVSWKIHQTLVRPRFKDLFDLMYLVQHTTFDKNTLKLSKQALINECIADNVDLNKLKHFLNYDIDKLFPNNSINETWNYWRYEINKQNYSGGILYYDRAKNLTNVENLPTNLAIFLKQFKESLESKGLNIELINDLNIPSIELETKPNQTNDKFKFEDNEARLLEKKSIWNRIKKLFQ